MIMGKKNLEQLFKESFQDFQEVPDQKVWASIKASLDNKKQKKRAVPIWWGLGGIAATLAILLLTINPFSEEPKEEQIISDRENISLPKSSENSDKGTDDSSNPSQIANKESLMNSEALEEKGSPMINNNLDVNSKTAVAANPSSNPKRIGAAVVGQAEKNSSFTKSEASLSKKEDTLNNNQVVVAKDEKNESLNEQVLFNKQEEAIAQNKKEEEDKKQSIYDAIEQQETAEEELAAENKTGKWSVGPSLAPVYFDATGDGSPVGPDFATNSKSGNLNLSYGLTVAYEVAKKIKIRSGIHRVNYGFSTNVVVFSSA